MATIRRQWRRANPERVKAIDQRAKRKAYARDPARIIRNVTNRLRRKQTTGRGVTQAEWLDRLAEFNDHCAYCLRPMNDTHLDPQEHTEEHMLPVSKGGSHDITNIVPACRSCNARKGTLSLLQLVALNDPTRPSAVF